MRHGCLPFSGCRRLEQLTSRYAVWFPTVVAYCVRKLAQIADDRGLCTCNEPRHAIAAVLTMKAIVSDKGGVTIPPALRRRLRIRPGDVLDLREQRGQLVVTKEAALDPVDAVYGILKNRQATDRLIRALRGAADAV